MNNSNIQNRYNSINCGQSKTKESKVLINCSEMTVNYTVMHCNTLHYTVEYTATQCSSDNKTRPNNSSCDQATAPREHTAAKKYCRKQI